MSPWDQRSSLSVIIVGAAVDGRFMMCMSTGAVMYPGGFTAV